MSNQPPVTHQEAEALRQQALQELRELFKHLNHLDLSSGEVTLGDTDVDTYKTRLISAGLAIRSASDREILTGTDLIYLDESFDGRYFGLSAIGIADHAWNDVFAAVKAWRESLRARFGVRMAAELHASPLVRGKGSIGPRIVTKYQRSQIFYEGLRLLAQQGPERAWIINCFPNPVLGHDAQMLAIEKMLNRINVSLRKRGRWGVILFDRTREADIRRLMRRLRVFNPIPSQYGAWPGGQLTKNITTDRILRDPVFVDSHADYLIQLADFVAFALLKSEVPPTPLVKRYGLHKNFAVLAPVLNVQAHPKDVNGIVR